MMTMPLLPQLYPDELLFSLLGRIHRVNNSISPKRTLDDLFGHRNVRAHPFLQTGLGRLAANLPPKRGLTAEMLAKETTLFPYLTAFHSADVRSWALETLIQGDAAALHVRLGLAAGSVRLPIFLRYCPACRANMLAKYGELYWRREHQLPGVLACREHGIPLAESHVCPAQSGQHAFIAADEHNCPANPPSPVWADRAEVMKLFWGIAQASTALLVSPPGAEPLVFWGGYYRQAMAERGLVKGAGSIDQSALMDAYLSHFGPVIGFFPDLAPDGWLIGIGRKHRKAVAPLHHLLLRLLLEALPLSRPRLQPFGPGPWACRNPLAGHYGQPVLADCQTHQEDGKTIGVFRCVCGYAFSMAAEPGSRPRILDMGPLFERRLRELVAAGTSLRRTAKALHVDTNTVRRYVQKFSLSSPWKQIAERTRLPPINQDAVRTRWVTVHQENPSLSRQQLRGMLPAEFIWLYRHDRAWLDAQPPLKQNRIGSKPRRDWPAIDAATVRFLRAEAFRLLAKTPPVSVTRAALERGLGPSNWLGKRLKKLPHSAAALDQVSETVVGFQERRIIWASAELARQNLPIQVWRLRRLAGLSGNCAPTVEAALQAAEKAAS